MAKHVILEQYSFVPATKTLTIIGKNIRREQLLLITNVTANTVIYNFSDNTLGAVSYATANNAGLETTTIVLTYNTAAMAANDKLAIMTEETYQEIIPSEVMRDPVDKMRVSTPQALIDTDFEYGMQPTKWESLVLLNNRPSAFYDFTQGLSNLSRTDITFPGSNTSPYQITNVTASARVVTVSINNTTGITAGLPIYIQGTLDDANASGWWLVETVSANTNFTYTTINIPATSLFDANKTYAFVAAWFTGAGIPTSSISMSGSVITVNTSNDHGLRVGDGIYIVGTTGTSGYATSSATINASWVVATTPTNSQFTINATGNAGSATLSGGANGTLYPRALGYVSHRPFDGGVQFSNLSPYHGYQTIRQTRRQFRYQSGKGIQFSTGSIVKPGLTADNLTSSGSTVTVTTKYAHGLLPGALIQITGANEVGYNGIVTVATVPNALTLTYTTVGSVTPTASPATGLPNVAPFSWYGASNRLGMFDSQNGFFFEFDGQTLSAVRRSSTFQISGTTNLTAGSQSVVGVSTKFSSQLKPGDTIAIRGMTYIVQQITSDTQLYIYPEYRGVTGNVSVVSKIVDTKFPQSSWNIDKMDGTGASLMTLDLTKMQMFYCDYTWYGAGAIRFGFKNNRGEVVYCHRIPNNNVNSEAYMRSGNLVARYETNTIPYITFLTSTLSSAATTGASISVGDVFSWPNAGTVVLTQASVTGAAIEYITYTSKSQAASLVGTTTAGSATILMANTTGVVVGQYISGAGIYPGTQVTSIITNTSIIINQPAFFSGTPTILFGPTLTIGARAQTGGNVSAQTFTFSATAPIRAELYSPQAASTISHWGSSVIMDGRYDDDKSLVFNAGNNAALSNLAQNVRQPILSLRIAPAVDNGLPGLLGQRELINRMQLTLRQMDVYTSGTAFRIEIFLNGRLSGGTFASVGGSSLAQVAYHTSGQTLSGGESIFGFFTSNSGAVTQDLSQVRDIGNSILGGGAVLTVPTTALNLYPDGPDIITVCCTNITSITTNTINSRLSWTEAQA